MKIQVVIPPVLALAIVGAWVGSQRQSIASIGEQNVVLRRKIAVIRTVGSSDFAVVRKPSASKSANERQPLDWEKIAAQIGASRRGGMGDMQITIRLQQQLQDMSTQEMLVALDQIDALDLPSESRFLLEQMFIEPLLSKDPQLALTRFVDRLADDKAGISWQLSDALKEWALKDSAKAGAWFDEQIVAGKFDSKSLDGKCQSRFRFEGSMIAVLLSSDPDAAGKRLAAVLEDQRADVLCSDSMQSLKVESQAAFAVLVRSQLPEKEQASAISQFASQIVSRGGYEEITAYLDRIKATPAERVKAVEETATSKIREISHDPPVTRADLDSMRAWVTAEAAGSIDKVTGKSLSNAIHNDKGMKFSDAANLAQEYGRTAGNDEVVATFLEEQGSSAREHRDEARAMAETIADEKRREKILAGLK